VLDPELLTPPAFEKLQVPAAGIAKVSVLIIPPGLKPVPGAHISLVPVDGKGKTTQLKITKNGFLYEGLAEFGEYVLVITAPGLSAPTRRFVIDRDVVGLPVHLAKASMPFFRLAKALIPFQPRSDLVGVGFEEGAPDKDLERELIAAIEAKLHGRLKPYELDGVPFQRMEKSVWLYQLVDSDGVEVMSDLRALLDALRVSAMVGTPFDLNKDAVRLITNQFVFRVKRSLYDQAYDSLNQLLGVQSIQRHSTDKEVWVVGLQPNSLEKTLSTIDCLVQLKVIVTGEPDLFLEIVNHQGAPNPDDPFYALQYKRTPRREGNHSYQRIREAWNVLYDRSATPKSIGSANVYIASLDDGINAAHAEMYAAGSPCLASDAQSQLSADCFDASKGMFCSDAAYTPAGPAKPHGMAVFGTISACTYNNTEVSGIAPGTHHIPVRRNQGGTSSTRYANTLLWLGGFDIPCPTLSTGSSVGHPCHWKKISRPADIINGSHGFVRSDGCVTQACLVLPIYTSSTFDTLVTLGRNSNGIVLVYSAGNGGYMIELSEPFAADPRTIAVSNCKACDDAHSALAPGSGRDGPSNYGDAVDVCALGWGTKTITPQCTNPPCAFGGTSAAAATVSGVAGLILSANSSLRSNEVRDVLRQSTRTIDSTGCSGYDSQGIPFGTGLLDACHAVRLAIQRLPLPDPEPANDPCEN
jgi:hypothetical protein